MEYIENVVVANSILDPLEILSNWSAGDWNYNELPKTMYGVEERFIPKIMQMTGVVSTTGIVRKNRPELWREIKSGEYLEIRWGKKKLFVVG